MKEIKNDTKDGEIHCVLWLEVSVLWKWLYYSKQSTVSMQSLSGYQQHYSQNLKIYILFV